MIYVAVAVIFLYLISVPITLRIYINANSDDGTGEIVVRLFFIPVFKKRFDPNRIFGELESKSANTSQAEKIREVKKKKPSGFLLSAAVKLLSVTVVRDLAFDAEIGTGDAAASAVICGFLRIFHGHLCDFLCCEKKGEITPKFDAEALNIRFFGIFSVCIADIIYVVAATLCDKIKKSIIARKNYAKSAAE